MDDGLFLDLPPGTQKELLVYFKNLLNMTWVKLAKVIGVNKSMVFFYCNDTCKMPIRHVEKLCLLSNSNINDWQLKTKSIPCCVRKTISLPVHNESLAEFAGILFGDGCLSKTSYATYVTCDARLDYEYVTSIVCSLFKDLFDVVPKLRIQKGAVHCYVYSKSLFDFLSTNLDFPMGEKKNKLIIPSWIIKNRRYLTSFIRGLFDTDGGVHRHHKNSIQLGYTSADPIFLKQVYFAMKSIGLDPKKGKYDVWFFGKAVDAFFNIIEPKNPKHLFKFKKFKDKKQVLLSKEMYAGAGIRTQVAA